MLLSWRPQLLSRDLLQSQLPPPPASADQRVAVVCSRWVPYKPRLFALPLPLPCNYALHSTSFIHPLGMFWLFLTDTLTNNLAQLPEEPLHRVRWPLELDIMVALQGSDCWTARIWTLIFSSSFFSSLREGQEERKHIQMWVGWLFEYMVQIHSPDNGSKVEMALRSHLLRQWVGMSVQACVSRHSMCAGM